MLYSVLFRFSHIHRWDQCAVYILYSKISTNPGLLKIRHSHRFVAVVIQFLIPLTTETTALFCQQVDPFELEQIKVLETFIDGRRNEVNKTYPVNFPGGTVKMYADESERKSMEGPVKSMKRKRGPPPMRQERKTAKNKRQ